MADEEIRRRKTGDPEMDAIVVLTQALNPLDRMAAKRVVEWARKRYVDDPLDGLSSDHMKSVTRFMEAIAQTAHEIGIAEPNDLLASMAKVAQQLQVDKVDKA